MKADAAERWVKAVNPDGTRGLWAYRMVGDPLEVTRVLDEVARLGA